jgi:hypothetical protein
MEGVVLSVLAWIDRLFDFAICGLVALTILGLYYQGHLIRNLDDRLRDIELKELDRIRRGQG